MRLSTLTHCPNFGDHLSQIVKEKIVKLRKVIFDKGKSFDLELLLLHSNKKEPEVVPIGKIVGMERPTVTKSWPKKENESLIVSTFSGGLASQIIRVIAYPVILLLTIFCTTVLADNISIEVRNRRVKKLFKKNSPKKGGLLDRLLNLYIHGSLEYYFKGGKGDLGMVMGRMMDKEFLDAKVQEEDFKEWLRRYIDKGEKSFESFKDVFSTRYDNVLTFMILADTGIVKFNNGDEVTVDHIAIEENIKKIKSVLDRL